MADEMTPGQVRNQARFQHRRHEGSRGSGPRSRNYDLRGAREFHAEVPRLLYEELEEIAAAGNPATGGHWTVAEVVRMGLAFFVEHRDSTPEDLVELLRRYEDE